MLLKAKGISVQAYVSQVGDLTLEKNYQELDLNQTEDNIVRCPDPEIAEEMITLPVQVNGKVRDRIEVPVGIDNVEAERLALDSEAVQRHVGDKRIVKVIVVPGRLVNVVLGK